MVLPFSNLLFAQHTALAVMAHLTLASHPLSLGPFSVLTLCCYLFANL